MAVTRTQTQSEELNRVQDKIVPALNVLLSIPILDGRLIETEKNAAGQEVALTIGTAFKLIEHKLGRKYRGFLVVGCNDNTAVWEDAPVFGTNPDPTKFIRMRCNVASLLLKLWVF
jgi:hypothetical protein